MTKATSSTGAKNAQVPTTMTNTQHEALVEAVARLRGLVATLHYECLGFVRHEGSPFDTAMTRAEAEFGNLHAIAALSATAATPSGEVVRLRSAHDQLEKTAREYATHYMQDEADGEEDCVCGQEQHLRAVAVFDALDDVARARAALEPHGKDT